MSAAGPVSVLSNHGNVKDLTPVLDTVQYADGDVLFVPIELTGAFPKAGDTAWLQTLFVLDEDDQGMGFDLIFFDASQTLGTINVAPSITDAAARSIIGRLPVSSGDYYDLGGSRIAQPEFIARELKSLVAGAGSLWVAGISRGTGTYTASGIKLKLGFAY
jgi:hypothetical protein